MTSSPTVTTLDNGVTLLNAPIASSRNVGVILIVRAGSRDETTETAGLAHFLEHLFFKGTRHRPTALEISREVDRLGAITNAYTDTEEVAYYGEGPATSLSELADVLCDLLSRPLFEAAEVERERNVVLQELAARLLRPTGWIGDRLLSVAFGGNQPMSWSAAGYPSVVAGVPRDAIVGYHADFYAPTSMALVVSGGRNLDPGEAAELLRDVPRAASKPRVPAQWGQGDRYIANVRPLSADEEPQVDMALALPGIPALDDDRTPLAVMTHIFGSGMSSRLFHTVREREGLAYRINAGHDYFDDAGLFTIGTATRPADAPRAVQLSVRELRRMAEEPVPEDELVAAKASMIGRLLRSTETAGNSAHWYAARWRAGLPLETPDERAEAIRTVSADDVLRVGQRIVAGLDQVRLALVGPQDQGTALLDAAA
ncbi:MAG TPA: pitrilysin family protein [Candidatus Dormibacteraeota bacterium]|jgi:predicted Zn-dependent peptidase|nr:pitrilysin family protein [Candidatus Dormibacteraeota bacterium]